MKLFKKTGSLIAILATAMSGLIGVVSASWNTGGENQNDNANTVSQTFTGTASEPICYRKSGSTILAYYNNVARALNDATSGQKVYIMSGKTITVNEDLEVKNGVELVLPYNSSEATLTFASSATSNRNILLTMANNADINVKTGGTLTIGGVLGTRGLIGAYSEINLSAGSSIMVNGTMNAYGKVTEKSQVTGYVSASNIVYDNSRDAGRFIKVTSSGSLVSTIGCYDIGGGSALTNKIDKGVCPTYNFEFPTLQTYVTVQYGGSLDAYAFVSIMNNDVNAKCGVIYPSTAESSTKSMFYQSSGETSIEWCSSSKTILYMNGYVKMGALYITGAAGYNIDTTNIFIGLTNRYCVFIGGTFDTNNKKVKFLPGCYVKNLAGGTIAVNGSSNSSKSQILFYEGNSFTSLGITTYGDTNAVFINNGTVNVNQYGCIAGYVDTEVTNGSAILNLSSVTNAANISLTTNEISSGASVNIPTIDLKGPFYDANNASNNYRTDSLFSVSTSYNTKNGYASWEGDILELVDVSLTVIRTGAQTESYSYSIYTNTSASTSGQTTLMSNITNVRTQNFTMVKNEYIRLVDTTCTEIQVNGTTYTSGTWMQVTGNVEIVITPTAAFNVKVHHTHGNSGAGSITRSVTWGPNSSNMNQNKKVTDGSAISVNIPAGWVFKVSDNASVSGTSQVKKTTYNEQGVGTTTVISSASGSIAWNSNTIYTADGDYEFVSDDVTCLVEGTLITMADGSKKPVEDVRVGDWVMALNYHTGKYEATPIIFNNHMDAEAQTYDVLTLSFNNGKSLSIAGNHGLFDATLRRYVFIDKVNYVDYIGHEFIYSDDGVENGTTILINGAVEERFTRIYAPVSYFYMNVIADDILTVAPPVTEDGRTIEGIVNYFDFNADGSWDLEAMNNDIAMYGLYSYEDFAEYISEEAYMSSPSVYLKAAVEKGYMEYEDIVSIIMYLLNNGLIDND